MLNAQAQQDLINIAQQEPWQLFWDSDPVVIADSKQDLYVIASFSHEPNMITLAYTVAGLEAFEIQRATGFEPWEPSELYADNIQIVFQQAQLEIKKYTQTNVLHELSVRDWQKLNVVIPQLKQLLNDLPSVKRINTQLNNEKVPTRQFRNGQWESKFRKLRIPESLKLFTPIKTTGLKHYRALLMKPASLEVAITFLAHPVVGKNEIPFYPRLLLIADHETGRILTQDVIDPKTTNAQALKHWLMDLMQAIGRPYHLYTHYAEGQYLQKINDFLDIRLTTDAPLQAIGKLYQALNDELQQAKA